MLLGSREVWPKRKRPAMTRGLAAKSTLTETSKAVVDRRSNGA